MVKYGKLKYWSLLSPGQLCVAPWPCFWPCLGANAVSHADLQLQRCRSRSTFQLEIFGLSSLTGQRRSWQGSDVFTSATSSSTTTTTDAKGGNTGMEWLDLLICALLRWVLDTSVLFDVLKAFLRLCQRPEPQLQRCRVMKESHNFHQLGLDFERHRRWGRKLALLQNQRRWDVNRDPLVLNDVQYIQRGRKYATVSSHDGLLDWRASHIYLFVRLQQQWYTCGFLLAFFYRFFGA